MPVVVSDPDAGRQTSCLHSRDCLPGFTCATEGPGTGGQFEAGGALLNHKVRGA